MNCTHGLTRNERCFCEPFVHAYNCFYSTGFSHVETPDKGERAEPMPDGLYLDQRSGLRLVIERTCIVYPEDYIKRHKSDHLIIDYLCANLPAELCEGPFVLEMPLLHEFRRTDEVWQLAREICEFLTENWRECARGAPLAFEMDSPPSYVYSLFHKDDCPWSDEISGPSDTIRFSMRASGGAIWRFDWRKLAHSGIPRLLDKATAHAARKFARFEESRRVLLVERRGDIYGPLNPEFAHLVSRASIPSDIDEIWDAWVETPDYDEPYWTYTRLWSRTAALPAGWILPEVCATVGCHCASEDKTEGAFCFESAYRMEPRRIHHDTTSGNDTCGDSLSPR